MVISEPHCSPCKILEVGVFVDVRVRSIAKTPRLHARHEIPVTVRASEFVSDQGCCGFGERSKDLVELVGGDQGNVPELIGDLSLYISFQHFSFYCVQLCIQ
jgi:hypothetical protein